MWALGQSVWQSEAVFFVLFEEGNGNFSPWKLSRIDLHSKLIIIIIQQLAMDSWQQDWSLPLLHHSVILQYFTREAVDWGYKERKKTWQQSLVSLGERFGNKVKFFESLKKGFWWINSMTLACRAFQHFSWHFDLLRVDIHCKSSILLGKRLF